MSKEAIDAVIAAENEAKEAKAKAVQESRQAIALASERAKSELEAAREAAMSDMNGTLAEIEAQSGALLLKSKNEAESDAAAETRAAMKHMDEAVKLIIGELMKNADN